MLMYVRMYVLECLLFRGTISIHAKNVIARDLVIPPYEIWSGVANFNMVDISTLRNFAVKNSYIYVCTYAHVSIYAITCQTFL